jgi:predicted dehydrogenase
MVQADLAISAPDFIAGLYDRKIGGGALICVGVYLISLADMVYGDRTPSIIHALGEKSKSGVDANLAMLLQYGSGQLATLHTAISLESTQDAIILGSKGRIVLKGPFWHNAESVQLTVYGQPSPTITTFACPIKHPELGYTHKQSVPVCPSLTVGCPYT